MVTSTYGDPARLEAFFDNDYHPRPPTWWKPGLELGMAVRMSFSTLRWRAGLPTRRNMAGGARPEGRRVLHLFTLLAAC